MTETITDHEGKFSLKVAQGTDSCQLVVEFIGYSKVSQEFVSDKSQLNLGAIVLKEDAISLEGATVSAKEVVLKSTVEHILLTGEHLTENATGEVETIFDGKVHTFSKKLLSSAIICLSLFTLRFTIFV